MIYYHNPRCSKSRKGLEILQNEKVDFKIKKYLEEGLTVEELMSLCSRLNKHPEEIVRKKESLFQDLEKTEGLSGEQWCEIIATNPILLERPIFDNGKRAIVGRPPEEINKIL